MKIAEIIGSVADQEPEAAPVNSFMQRIANAFTASGRVKRPLGFQGSEEPATTAVVPHSYLPASEEGTSTAANPDAIQNAGTTIPTLTDPRREFRSPLPARHVNPFTAPASYIGRTR